MPQELYQKYDCSEMAFNPAIVPPKSIDLNKQIKGRHFYMDKELECSVNGVLSSSIQTDGTILDFYQEFRKNSTKLN